jgi:hypothetical protein
LLNGASQAFADEVPILNQSGPAQTSFLGYEKDEKMLSLLTVSKTPPG